MLETAAIARAESAIATLDSRTDAELVVVVAPRSSSGNESGHLVGHALALVALAVLLCIHRASEAIEDDLIPPLVALAYGVGWALGHTALGARASRTTWRFAHDVRRAAHATFVREKIHATRRRDGLLVYISLAEPGVEVVPDLGLEGKVPSAVWHGIARATLATLRAGPVEDAVAVAVAKATDVLTRSFPKTPHDQDELPHRVRVLS